MERTGTEIKSGTIKSSESLSKLFGEIGEFIVEEQMQPLSKKWGDDSISVLEEYYGTISMENVVKVLNKFFPEHRYTVDSVYCKAKRMGFSGEVRSEV